jgi:glycosyltransferase involved in cell wall biosynthesis
VGGKFVSFTGVVAQQPEPGNHGKRVRRRGTTDTGEPQPLRPRKRRPGGERASLVAVPRLVGLSAFLPALPGAARASILPAVPLVSVIIPAHNREALIDRAVDSALRQTIADLEVLVVDDASSDGTVARLEARPADRRLRLLRHAVNRGAAAARNTGIAAAQGEFVAFLDSDDEWLPEKLERQLACLATAPEDVLLCCSGYWMMRERSREVTARIPQKRGSWRDTLLDGCTLSPGSTALIRRRAFEIHGLLDESLRRLEDWDWLLRYAARHDLVLVPEPLARVFIAERVNADAVRDALKRLGDKHLPALRRRGFGPAARFRAALRLEEAAASFYGGRYARAALFMAAAVATYPRRPAAFFRQVARRALRLLRHRAQSAEEPARGVPSTGGWLIRKKPEI